jgi:hypothetical protein
MDRREEGGRGSMECSLTKAVSKNTLILFSSLTVSICNRDWSNHGTALTLVDRSRNADRWTRTV